MPKLDQTTLAQFTGTERWYRHWAAPKITYTDGVKYVAETAGAFWLLDEIVFAQRISKISSEEFQVWKLAVSSNAVAILTCEDGNDNEVYRQLIPYTDFPEPEIALWLTNNVILLPSEY
jgi:hypothetical protein